MKKQSLLEFADFASDHLDHFGAWPLEFEDSEEKLWPIADCWDALAEYPSLDKLLWDQVTDDRP
jgi:hypothetical protein